MKVRRWLNSKWEENENFGCWSMIHGIACCCWLRAWFLRLRVIADIMFIMSVHHASIRCAYSSCSRSSCLFIMDIHRDCSSCLFIVSVHRICSSDLFIVLVHRVYSSCLFIMFVHTVYSSCLFIVSLVHHACSAYVRRVTNWMMDVMNPLYEIIT